MPNAAQASIPWRVLLPHSLPLTRSPERLFVQFWSDLPQLGLRIAKLIWNVRQLSWTMTGLHCSKFGTMLQRLEKSRRLVGYPATVPTD